MSVRMQKGFTFIEMLTAVAVLALIGAMVIPGMQSFQRNSRMASLAEDIQSSLVLARSSSITGRRTVVWVRTASPEGWQVHWDSETGPVITDHTVTATGAVYTILQSAASPTTPPTQIRFEPSGIVKRHDSNTAMDFEFRVCSSDVTDETGRSVRISRLGRLAGSKHAGPSVCN